MTSSSAARVFAVDTSSHTQVIALLEGDTVLHHTQHRIAFNHGSSLLRLFDTLLNEHELTPQQLDLLVIGAGPGSFTGLRVGMAMLKGIARAAQVPIVRASTLASMAHVAAQFAPTTPVCSAIDARKKEVYTRVSQRDAQGQEVILTPEQTFAPDALRAHLHELAEAHGQLILVERQLSRYPALRDLDARIIRPGLMHEAPHGVAMAHIGREIFARQGGASLTTLEPNYIRASDAEVQRAKREARLSS